MSDRRTPAWVELGSKQPEAEGRDKVGAGPEVAGGADLFFAGANRRCEGLSTGGVRWRLSPMLW